MSQFFSKLVVGQHGDEFQQQELSLWDDQELAVFSYYHSDEGQALNALVFKVRRNPKNLLAHLRRIYFCYQQRLSAQLYAALLDFVIVLQGKGWTLSRRMIEASRSQLDSQQFQSLTQAAGHERLGNAYSLFSTGQIGRCELVDYQQQVETQHDFLVLANDFIEYCQLEQAMEVLETGIGLHPDRQDLQQALLELYKSTGNRERFQTFRRTFSESGVSLVKEWLVTANFFEGHSL